MTVEFDKNEIKVIYDYLSTGLGYVKSCGKPQSQTILMKYAREYEIVEKFLAVLKECK